MKITFDIGTENLDFSEGLLLAEMGLQGITMGIVEMQTQTLKRFVYAEGDNQEGQLLKELLAQYPEFNAKMQKTGIGFRVPAVVFVPESLYRFHEETLYLESAGVPTTALVIQSEKPADQDFYTIYGIPRLLNGLVSREFFHHEAHHCLTVAAANAEDRLEVDIRPTEFQVVLVQDGHPQLLNQYSYTEPLDIVYRLLQICHQFTANQNQIELRISGFIAENSTLYQQLYLHFGNIQFAQPTDEFRIPVTFSDMPDYYFHSLLNLAACVSSPVH